MKNTFYTAIALCLCCLSFEISAQSRDYIVEMIVFKRPQASVEEWPSTIELAYPDNRAYFVGDRPPASVKRGNNLFGELGSGSYEMAAEAQRLNRQSGYKVLFHKAWKQSIGAKSQAPGLVILGGQNSRGMRELSGYARFSLGRYLHIDANLWLASFSNTPRKPWPDLPSPFEFNKHSTTRSNANLNRGDDLFLSYDNGIGRIVTLKQSRRMRSHEPHYIDHPIIGIIVEIRKSAETAN